MKQITKRFHLWNTVAILLALLASCTPKEKTVDYPLTGYSNTDALDIARVELNDSATVLHINATYRPHFWICISSESYLQADGKKYALTGTEGIQADSLFWMPESGKASFTLCFEPMPRKTRSFDFIESDREDFFRIYDIDLTGKNTYGYPEGLPAELRKQEIPDTVPAPIFQCGTTTVRVHLLKYRPEFGIKEVELFLNTLFNGQDSYSAKVSQETGIAEFTFPQYGSAEAVAVVNNKMLGVAWLAPGETVDLYADMRVFGYYKTYNRDTEENASKPGPLQRMYATGTYAGLNRFHNLMSADHTFHGINLYSGEFADYKMSSAEYAAHVVDSYKTRADSIAQSDKSGLDKELNTLMLRQQVCLAMSRGNTIRAHNYRHIHNQWNPNIPVKNIDPLKPEDAQAILDLFDINDPKLLMAGSLSDYTDAILSGAEVDWINEKELPDGLVKNLRQIAGFSEKAQNATLDEADFAKLKAMDNPFYYEAFSRMQKDTEEKLAKLSAQTEATPDVPKEKLFEAIIAPHKGKVILVDFWNTWCGPCRAAIKANEPLKSGELKNDDLVWIYIANETSPLSTYQTLITDIQGLHYRLNQEQWSYLVSDRFDIDGIPSYVVVDKAGRADLRNDFRDHNLMKETLKKLLAE